MRMSLAVRADRMSLIDDAAQKIGCAIDILPTTKNVARKSYRERIEMTLSV